MRLSTLCSVGARSVQVDVSGQSVTTPSITSPLFSPLLIVCGAGFFGRIGEACLPCPSPGATCAGYNASIAPSTLGGLLSDPADAPNTYPVALPGFYSLSLTCTGNATSPCHSIVNASTACPAMIAAAFPGRDTCIVGCRPPGAVSVLLSFYIL